MPFIILMFRHLLGYPECDICYKRDDKLATGKFCMSYFKSGCCDECNDNKTEMHKTFLSFN